MLALIITSFKQFKILFRMLSWAFRIKPILLPLILSLNFLTSLAPFALIWIGKLILDEVVSLVNHSGSLNHLYLLILLEIALRISQQLLNELLTQLNTRFSTDFEHEVRKNFLRSNEKVPYHQFEDTEYHDKLTLIINHVFYGASSYVNQQLAWLRSLTQLSSTFVLLLDIDFYFVICIFGVNLLRLLIRVHYSKKGYQLSRDQSKDKRKIAYLFEMLTQARYVRDIKLYCLESYFGKLYLKLHKKIIQEDRKFQRKQIVSSSFFEMISVAFFYVFYLYILKQVVRGVLSIGDITVYQRSYNLIESSIGSVVLSAGSLYKSNQYVGLFFNFIDDVEKNRDYPKEEISSFQTLSLDNISFKYPGTEKLAVNNVSISLKKGDFVAIVGENGSGKTTLLKLLLGLFNIEHGSILYNGKRIDQLAMSSIYHQIGCLFTDFNRYHLSYDENIQVGDLDRGGASTYLQSITERVELKDLVDHLPKKGATYLSRYLESGVDLSSGQWQRIGFARLLYRDPKLVLLDEPTTHLDNHFCSKLMEMVHGWQKLRSKTTVVIAHKIRTVRRADMIYFMNQGELIEKGTHEELLQKEGAYADLWRKENN